MTDKTSPTCKCGKPMIARQGKFGQFWGCSNYPRCKNTQQMRNGKFAANVKKPIAPRELKRIETPSPYQQHIFDAVEELIKVGSYESAKNLIVEACAGSGKTATIEHIISIIKEIDPVASIVYLVFNKRVQIEAQEKGLPAATTHSKYYRDYATAYGKVQIENYKVRNIVDKMLKKEDEWMGTIVCQIISKVKNTRSATDNETLDSLCSHYGILVNGDADVIYDLVRKALVISDNQVKIVDFDDMLYLTEIKNVPIKKFDWVLVDEVQDFNRLQCDLVVKTIAKHAVVVGDRNQSIYAFRGAALDSMDRVKEALDAKEMPLSITYRCPKSHVALINELFPHIKFEAFEHAKEGEIASVPMSHLMQNGKDGDLVVCRTNAPLVRPAFEMIRSGKKAIILGRDIGKGLIALINKQSKTVKGKYSLDEDLLNAVLDKLNEYRIEQVARLLKRKKVGAAQTLDDQVKTIEAIAEECKSLNELKKRIESIFSDDKDGVTFSSVHKIKGGQADTVYILESNKMPHPMAELSHEKEQEKNISYVAFTRSKDKMYFVDAPIPYAEQFIV
jgi:superfamily I DNA/RNA helicase